MNNPMLFQVLGQFLSRKIEPRIISLWMIAPWIILPRIIAPEENFPPK